MCATPLCVSCHLSFAHLKFFPVCLLILTGRRWRDPEHARLRRSSPPPRDTTDCSWRTLWTVLQKAQPTCLQPLLHLNHVRAPRSSLRGSQDCHQSNPAVRRKTRLSRVFKRALFSPSLLPCSPCEGDAPWCSETRLASWRNGSRAGTNANRRWRCCPSWRGCPAPRLASCTSAWNTGWRTARRSTYWKRRPTMQVTEHSLFIL